MTDEERLLKRRQHSREWLKRHPGYDSKVRAALRKGMFDAYGSVCACCSEEERIFLTLDHELRNGGEHRRLHKGGNVLYDLRNREWPQDEGYRILCMNCNFAMRWGRKCPHDEDDEVNGDA